MSTATRPKRPAVKRRAGQYAITRITGRPDPGPHDVVTLLALLDEFYDLPLTLDDIRAELGWQRARIRNAVDLAKERNLISDEPVEERGPAMIRRVKEATYPHARTS